VDIFKIRKEVSTVGRHAIQDISAPGLPINLLIRLIASTKVMEAFSIRRRIEFAARVSNPAGKPQSNFFVRFFHTNIFNTHLVSTRQANMPNTKMLPSLKYQ
jgi:hypothetical protein